MRKITVLVYLLLSHCVINAQIIDKQLSLYPIYFYGGLTSIDPYNANRLKPYSCLNIENYYFDNNNLFQSRDGWDNYVTITNINKTPNNIIQYKNNNTNQNFYLISYDTDLYRFVNNSFTKINIDTAIKTYNNYKRGFITEKSILYFGDGANNNYKWSGGDTTYIMGVQEPQSSLTAASSGIGSVDTGEHKYLYTFVSKKTSENFLEVESNPNENPTTITLTNGDSGVALSNIAVSNNPAVTHKRIYRTKANLTTVYFLVDEISNDSTSYVDTKNDLDLGTSQLERYTRSQPIASKYFIKYKGRIWFAGNNIYKDRLYFSGYNTPEYIDLDYDYVTDIENNEIIGMSIVNGNLVIFTDKSVWAIYISDEDVLTPANWRKVEISKGIGCISNKSIVNLENGVIFLSNKGLFSLGINFAGDVSANGAFLYLSEEIKNDYDNYISKYPSFVSAIYKDFYYYMTYSTNGYYNNKIYVYNTRIGKGTFYTGYFANNFLYDLENDVFLASSSLKDGLVLRLENDYIYDGIYQFDVNITTTSEVWSSVYNETLIVCNLTERLTTDTSITDTNLLNSLVGQSLYLYSGDTNQYINFVPIISNDSQSITVKTDFTPIDTGIFARTGTRNHIIETVYYDISGEFIEKAMQYMFLGLYVENGLMEVLAYYDNEFDYITTIIENEQEVYFYINNDPIQYINDNNFLNDFVGYNDKYKLSYELKNTFNQIKFKTIVNTFNALTPTKLYVWYKDLRVNWIGDK